MKLAEIYKIAVDMGKAHDVRGEYLEELLEERQRQFGDLSE